MAEGQIREDNFLFTVYPFVAYEYFTIWQIRPNQQKMFKHIMFKNRGVKKKIGECLGGFPGGTVVKNPPANAGDTGSSPGLGRSHMPQSN